MSCACLCVCLCLFVCLCSSICTYICLSVFLSVCLSICLWACMCTSLCLSERSLGAVHAVCNMVYGYMLHSKSVSIRQPRSLPGIRAIGVLHCICCHTGSSAQSCTAPDYMRPENPRSGGAIADSLICGKACMIPSRKVEIERHRFVILRLCMACSVRPRDPTNARRRFWVLVTRASRPHPSPGSADAVGQLHDSEAGAPSSDSALRSVSSVMAARA